MAKERVFCVDQSLPFFEFGFEKLQMQKQKSFWYQFKMGIRNYLIEGVSGVGKTTVAEELERRGFHVIHGDRVLGYLGNPVTGEAIKKPIDLSGVQLAEWRNAHWIWPLEIVKYLILSQLHSVTFFCGSSRNSQQFIDLFDKVFVLEIDLATLYQRLNQRPEEEFGGKKFEKKLIMRLHAEQHFIPKQSIRINAAMPVANVVEQILDGCQFGG